MIAFICEYTKKAIKLYILTHWVEWYMDYVSIKPLSKIKIWICVEGTQGRQKSIILSTMVLRTDQINLRGSEFWGMSSKVGECLIFL